MNKVSGEYMVLGYIGKKAWENKPKAKEDVIGEKYRSNYFGGYYSLKNNWTFNEVMELLGSGHSIQNGRFREPNIEANEKKGTFCGAQFLEANMLIVDIDSNNFSIEDILEKSKPYTPSAIYKTLSYKEDNRKYRVIFLADSKMNREAYQKITLYFINKLDGDTKCKDPGRLYFGGKEVAYFNPNLLEIEELLQLPEVIQVETSVEDKVKRMRKTKIYGEKMSFETEKIFKTLKNLKVRNKPECVERNESFKFINSLPLTDILGVNEGDMFRCVMPDHNDSTPSATLYGDNRFICFGCMDRSLSVLDTLQMITGMDLFELQLKILNVMGIKFGSDYQNSAYQTLQYNRTFITSDRESRIFKKLKSVNQLKFYLEFIQYVENNLPKNRLVDGYISLFASYGHIAEFMLDINGKPINETAINNMKAEISKKTRSLTKYGLIGKIKHNELPQYLKEKAEEVHKASNHKYKTTYWYIPKLTPSLIEAVLDMQEEEKKHGYIKRVEGRTEMLVFHGIDKTENVYNQDVLRFNEKVKETTRSVINHILCCQGYFTKQMVKDNNPYKEVTVDKYIPGIAKELGYEEVRINKIYRERFSISENEMKKGSRLYVKEKDKNEDI